MIDRFRGSAYFLSNFYHHPVVIGDDVYPTAEHAFQALKADDPQERAWILDAQSPLLAKRRGRKVRIVSYWADVRVRVMEQVLEAKFSDPQLAQLLIATYPEKLVEGNDWHDQFWGDCYCGSCMGEGQNVLGVTLMGLRDKLRR